MTSTPESFIATSADDLKSTLALITDPDRVEFLQAAHKLCIDGGQKTKAKLLNSCITRLFASSPLASTVAASAPKSAPVPATVPLEIVPATTRALAANPQNLADLLACLDEAIRCHRAGGLQIARGITYVAMAGNALSSIKKKLGHGKWLPFVKEHLEPAGMPERTCQHYMQVWESTKVKALKSNSPELKSLLDAPIDSLSDENKALLFKIASAVSKGVSGETLLIESGLKKPAKEKGGNHPRKGPEPTTEQIEADLVAEAQSRFREFQNLGFQAGAMHGRERELILRLPVFSPDAELVTLVSLRDILKPFLGLIEDTIDARKHLAA